MNAIINVSTTSNTEKGMTNCQEGVKEDYIYLREQCLSCIYQTDKGEGKIANWRKQRFVSYNSSEPLSLQNYGVALRATGKGKALVFTDGKTISCFTYELGIM